MNDLKPSDFPRFYEAIHGYQPYPWQTRLLNVVAAEGWPDTLDLPTAAGKTSVLDIAVFSLALDAHSTPRRAPLRVGFVIDRRIVVDQAFRHARKIADTITTARSGVLADVAARLRSLRGLAGRDNPDTVAPLGVSVLRGGMPRDTDWALRPDQPWIVASTVDQVGSRLLFRGYGVSDTMQPVHAGLLGEDVLYLLDEVHLSRPFYETLRAVRDFARQNALQERLPARMECVSMSATPGRMESRVFALDSADWSDTKLAPRLKASKPAVLRLVDTPKDEMKARDRIADACVREMRTLVEQVTAARRAAIIVNRVDTARRVAAEAEHFTDWRVHLMTGRMRPLDRDDLIKTIEPSIGARGAEPTGRTLVVSTQAIEAGADFDFDVMVTECASLDALRQRMGRLNRAGAFAEARATVVAGSTQVEGNAGNDAVYGAALAKTWMWLNGAAGDSMQIDLGTESLDDRLRGQPQEVIDACLASRKIAPVLLPAFLDLWSQTAPRPEVQPEIAPFLHGDGQPSVDVQVVWRADIQADWLSDIGNRSAWESTLTDMLSACPPSSLESLAVPCRAVRSWLAGREQNGVESVAVADVEGADDEGDDERVAVRRIAPILIWRDEQAQIVDDPRDITPGSTLVVPSIYAGLGKDGNWDPSAASPSVTDRGDQAQLLHRGRASVRWTAWSADVEAGPQMAGDLEELTPDDERQAYVEWASAVLAKEIPDWARITLQSTLRGRTRIVRVSLPRTAETELQRVWRISVGARRVSQQQLKALRHGLCDYLGAAESTTDGDAGNTSSRAISLRAHVSGVVDYARAFGPKVGLDDRLTQDLILAASLHDVGKIDPRFQLLLHDGDEVSHALATEPLAKSGMPLGDRAGRKRASERAGYPAGTRHELFSAALTAASPILDRASDPDLVLHLIESHHGYCRPLAPLVLDPAPREIEHLVDGVTLRGSTAHGLSRLDAGVADRFWRLTRKYGWWRLAWLESLLRLADHRASQDQEVSDD